MLPFDGAVLTDQAAASLPSSVSSLAKSRPMRRISSVAADSSMSRVRPCGLDLAPRHRERGVGRLIEIDLVHQPVGLHEFVEFARFPCFGPKQKRGRLDRASTYVSSSFRVRLRPFAPGLFDRNLSA